MKTNEIKNRMEGVQIETINRIPAAVSCWSSPARARIKYGIAKMYGIQIMPKLNAIPVTLTEKLLGDGAESEVRVLVDVESTRAVTGKTAVVDVVGRITAFLLCLGELRVVGKEKELIVSRLPLYDVNQEFVEPVGDVLRGTSSGMLR